MKTIRLLLAIGTLTIAAISHSYYTDYGSAVDGFLARLFEAGGDDATHVHDQLKKPVLETPWVEILKSNNEESSPEEEDAALKLDVKQVVAEISLDDAKSDVERRAAAADLARLKNIDPYQESRLRANQLLEIEMARIDSIKVYFGILPARALDGKARFSNEKSFWLGVVFPATLALLALMIAFSPVRTSLQRKNRKVSERSFSKDDAGELAPHTSNQTHQKPLADLLKAHFGADFPVGSGSAKRDAPLVITAARDYVSVEYAVAEFLLSAPGESFKFDGQALTNNDDRYVDELTTLQSQMKPATGRQHVGSSLIFQPVTQDSASSGLTIHSSRNRFAVRLNSGVRPHT